MADVSTSYGNFGKSALGTPITKKTVIKIKEGESYTDKAMSSSISSSSNSSGSYKGADYYNYWKTGESKPVTEIYVAPNETIAPYTPVSTKPQATYNEYWKPSANTSVQYPIQDNSSYVVTKTYTPEPFVGPPKPEPTPKLDVFQKVSAFSSKQYENLADEDLKLNNPLLSRNLLFGRLGLATLEASSDYGSSWKSDWKSTAKSTGIFVGGLGLASLAGPPGTIGYLGGTIAHSVYSAPKGTREKTLLSNIGMLAGGELAFKGGSKLWKKTEPVRITSEVGNYAAVPLTSAKATFKEIQGKNAWIYVTDVEKGFDFSAGTLKGRAYESGLDYSLGEYGFQRNPSTFKDILTKSKRGSTIKYQVEHPQMKGAFGFTNYREVSSVLFHEVGHKVSFEVLPKYRSQFTKDFIASVGKNEWNARLETKYTAGYKKWQAPEEVRADIYGQYLQYSFGNKIPTSKLGLKIHNQLVSAGIGNLEFKFFKETSKRRFLDFTKYGNKNGEILSNMKDVNLFDDSGIIILSEGKFGSKPYARTLLLEPESGFFVAKSKLGKTSPMTLIESYYGGKNIKVEEFKGKQFRRSYEVPYEPTYADLVAKRKSKPLITQRLKNAPTDRLDLVKFSKETGTSVLSMSAPNKDFIAWNQNFAREFDVTKVKKSFGGLFKESEAFNINVNTNVKSVGTGTPYTKSASALVNGELTNSLFKQIMPKVAFGKSKFFKPTKFVEQNGELKLVGFEQRANPVIISKPTTSYTGGGVFQRGFNFGIGKRANLISSFGQSESAIKVKVPTVKVNVGGGVSDFKSINIPSFREPKSSSGISSLKFPVMYGVRNSSVSLSNSKINSRFDVSIIITTRSIMSTKNKAEVVNIPKQNLIPKSEVVYINKIKQRVDVVTKQDTSLKQKFSPNYPSGTTFTPGKSPIKVLPPPFKSDFYPPVGFFVRRKKKILNKFRRRYVRSPSVAAVTFNVHASRPSRGEGSGFVMRPILVSLKRKRRR